MTGPTLNIDEALDFFKAYNPAGPWVPCAICPKKERKWLPAGTFPPVAEDLLRKWIQQHHDEKWNLYFHANDPCALVFKRMNREQVKLVRGTWVDVDPREGFDLEEERARILGLFTTTLPQGVPPPTCIIDSGNGYQAWWKYKKPITMDGTLATAEAVGSYGKQLTELFGGADKCHSVDHLFRLPGTVNLPTLTKLARGITKNTRARLL
jgi:hypothetical protein